MPKIFQALLADVPGLEMCLKMSSEDEVAVVAELVSSLYKLDLTADLAM
jgi:hypothetical protein